MTKVIAVLVYGTGYDVNGFARRYQSGIFMRPYVLDVMHHLTEQALKDIGVQYEIYNFNLQLKKDADDFHALEEKLSQSSKHTHCCKYCEHCETKVILACIGVMSYQLVYAIETMRRWNKFATCFVGGPTINGAYTEMLKGIPEGSPCPQKLIGEIATVLQEKYVLFLGDAYPAQDNLWREALNDAITDNIKPVYDAGWAPLENAPVPEWKLYDGYLLNIISIDQQSGCPYWQSGKGCNFCAIGSLSGTKTRERNIESVLNYLEESLKVAPRGTQPFILGDNGARMTGVNKLLEGLRPLHEKYGFLSSIQADTQCHKIQGFLDLCEKAGISAMFIGVESSNPDALKVIDKKQNKPEEYKQLCDELWERGIVPLGSTMIGQEHHTPAVIKKEVEQLLTDGFWPMFTILSPSPGSPLGSKLRFEDKVPTLAQTNDFDSSYTMTDCPLMTRQECQESYWWAWRRTNSLKFQIPRLRRFRSWKKWLPNIGMAVGFWAASRERVHPLMLGRKKIFDLWDRKPTAMPISKTEHNKLIAKKRWSEFVLMVQAIGYAITLFITTMPLLKSLQSFAIKHYFHRK